MTGLPDVRLAVAAGEPEFADPKLTGDWADDLAAALAAPQVPPWCSYVAREDGRVVGSCGFKGGPDAARAVEIGYITLAPERGRNVAQAMCARMVALAAESGAAAVIAHTLPEENASARVLRANGFALGGPVIDPEDGEVWRWTRDLEPVRQLAHIAPAST